MPRFQPNRHSRQGEQAYDAGNDGGDFRGQPPARSAGRLFSSQNPQREADQDKASCSVRLDRDLPRQNALHDLDMKHPSRQHP